MLPLLQSYGYTSVCWCNESTGKLDSSHRMRPPAVAAAVPSAASSTAQPVRQLMRMNMHVEEDTHVAAIHASRDVLRQYDLVAVVPHSESALEKCLQAPAVEHIDVISLPSAQRWPFVLRQTLVQKALKAGLHFELCYSAALKDGLSRRHLVSNVQALVELLLPKQRRAARGLLVSSGADACRLLRSPQDVANLLVLFGCHPAAAQQAVVDNPRAALERAAQRRLPPPLAALPTPGLLPAAPQSSSSSQQQQQQRGKKRKG
jgi:ribonuclease P/MRP protein subunit RPP1